jgi:hypothetical protein
MSVVQERIKALKRQLNAASTAQIELLPDLYQARQSAYVAQLNASLAILSAPSHMNPSLDQIVRIIIDFNQARIHEPEHILQDDYTQELEWLLLARCAVDVYGCILEQLFKQTLPLARDIFYWDDILSQPWWRLLFLIQSQTTVIIADDSLAISRSAIWQGRLRKYASSVKGDTYAFLLGDTPNKSARSQSIPENGISDEIAYGPCYD